MEQWHWACTQPYWHLFEWIPRLLPLNSFLSGRQREIFEGESRSSPQAMQMAQGSFASSYPQIHSARSLLQVKRALICLSYVINLSYSIALMQFQILKY